LKKIGLFSWVTYPSGKKKEWSHCNGWPTQVEGWPHCNGWPTQKNDGLIVMGDLPKEKEKSGLIVMGDLPR
jgi:hypothetical protein